MRKILNFSLLLLALTLAGCGSDKKNVSIEISPQTTDLSTGGTVLLRVIAKNTSIIMPDPTKIPGSFKLIGTTGIQYTAPQDPPKAADGLVKVDDIVEIEVVAAADNSKKATATLKVLYEMPAGTVDPGNVILFHRLSDNMQFTATFPTVKNPRYATPRYKLIPDKHWVNDHLEPYELGHFRDEDSEGYSYTGAFIHDQVNSGVGTIEATLELDPAIYGRTDGKTRKARATARVRVRPPSDRFQWITLLTGVGYGTNLNTAPVLSRPFFTDDGLTVDPNGQYVVYHSCRSGTTTCSQRLLRKDKGVREGEVLNATSDGGNTIANPNLALPIPVRAIPAGSSSSTVAKLDDPFTDAIKAVLPQGALNAIPSKHDIGAGLGASHPSLTSLTDVTLDGVPSTIGVFELSLNAWPPAARLFLLSWPNDIKDDEPMWWGYSCTNTQLNNKTCPADPPEIAAKRQAQIADAISSYDITPFNFNPPFMAKIVRSIPPKPPTDDDGNGGFEPDKADEWKANCLDMELSDPWSQYCVDIRSYRETYALGYYDGARMSVRRVIFEPKMRLADRAIVWNPKEAIVRDRTTRNYLTDLVYENYDDFIAVGVRGEMDPTSVYTNYYSTPNYVTAWRYVYGLAMVRRTNKEYDHEMDVWRGYCEVDEEGNLTDICHDPIHDVWQNVDMPAWRADDPANAAEYDKWVEGGKSGAFTGTPPPAEPEEPEKVITDNEELREILGLKKFRIMYAVRDPLDDCLIVVGYGTDIETEIMTGFMAKSYNKAFEQKK